MIEKLRASWRSYRAKMRQQRLDHALHKAQHEHQGDGDALSPKNTQGGIPPAPG